MRRIWIWSVLIAAILGLAAGIGCGDGKQEENNTGQTDPWADFEPDPDLYTYQGEPSGIIEQTDSDGVTVRFPVDLFVFSLEEGIDRSAADDVASAVDGELVGQIPEIRYYQIHLDTTTLPELDAAIESAAQQAGVEWADYDLMVEPRQEQCVADCDNLTLAEPERCQFDDTHVFQATYIFDQLGPVLEPQPVALGIVDSGVNVGNGEFDDIRIVNAHKQGAKFDGRKDTDGHGTMVAGVMVADDGDGGVNGVASRILGDRVTLVSGVAGQTGHQFLHGAARVVDAHAEVVNISWGFGFGVLKAPGDKRHKKWVDFLKKHPDVLFVVAADNEPQTLTNWNDAPAGIQLPNVISVGGTAHCDPSAPFADSARGGLIDIAAQASSVTVVDPASGRPPRAVSGTSVATPQVSSAAAVLRSLRPDLSPSQIKTHLTFDGVLPGPEEVGGAFLSTAGAMESMLVTEEGTDPEILNYVDADRDQQYEPPGLVVGRLCGGLNYQVEGLGSFHVSELDEDVTGLITTQGTQVVSFYDEQRPTLGLNMYGSFDLTDYPIVEPGDFEPGQAEVSVSYIRGTDDNTLRDYGTSMDGGKVQLTWCEILQRNPLDDNPLNVMVEGVFEGVLLYTVVEPYSVDERRFSGMFRMPFTVSGPELGEAVANMESKCVGGKNR
jgi:subtilisin family serine protease